MQGTEDGPSEIEDEYQLGLAIGVDDESSEQATSISFSITSYGADYPTPSSSCNGACTCSCRHCRRWPS